MSEKGSDKGPTRFPIILFHQDMTPAEYARHCQEELAPEIPLEQIDREAIPDYALVDSRMREQRAADGQGRAPGICSGGPSPEQGPLVPIATMDPEVRAAIEALRGWVQECSDGVSNLGMRMAKLEDAAQEWRSRQHSINGDIYRDMHRYDDKLALASINGDNALDQRIQARAIELEHKIDALEAASTKGERVERVERQAADIGLQRQVRENLAVADRRFHDRNERLDNYQSRLNRIERQAHRVRKQFPSVGEPTPAQALAAIGLEEAPQSTGEPTTILITRQGLDELKTTAREGDDE